MRRDVRGEEFAVVANHRRRQPEGRLGALLVADEDVERRLSGVSVVGRVAGHRPEGVGGEELSRFVDMILGQQATLDLEKVLRITEVGTQLVGNLVFGLDGSGKGTHPGPQHRVVSIELKQRYGSVVGVHGCLDGVTHVRHLLALPHNAGRAGHRALERAALCVRIGVQGGVGVDDPDDPPVHHHRIGVVVGGQPRRHALHPFLRVAMDQPLRLRADLPGEQELVLGELGGKHRAVEPVSDRHTPGAGIGVLGRVGVILARRGPRGSAHDRVVRIGLGDHLAVVDPWLLDRDDLAPRTQRRDVTDGVYRVPAVAVGNILGIAGRRVHPIGRGGHEAVAMRVDGVFVDPVGLIAGEAFRRELPDADDVVLQLTVDAIAIDVEYLGEAKEILELLLLGEGSGQDMRVQQPHLGNRGDIHGHVARLFGTDARIATVLDPIATDPIRLAGRFDVALDIWAFDIGGVGTHRELLHQQRPQSTDQDRRQHQQCGGHRRNPQVAQKDRGKE
ncbi:Uncharacterised protein [Mycobacterium tuberculosis]|nr:Uncharacterised protein [Mycobacterium tuberculosis]